jgi:predicted SpoU family rRNA methylase
MARSRWSARKYGNLKIYLPSKEQMKKNKKLRNVIKKIGGLYELSSLSLL